MSHIKIELHPLRRNTIRIGDPYMESGEGTDYRNKGLTSDVFVFGTIVKVADDHYTFEEAVSGETESRLYGGHSDEVPGHPGRQHEGVAFRRDGDVLHIFGNCTAITNRMTELLEKLSLNL